MSDFKKTGGGAVRNGSQNILISVIIPVYNMESYLSRCLDSVISNSY